MATCGEGMWLCIHYWADNGCMQQTERRGFGKRAGLSRCENGSVLHDLMWLVGGSMAVKPWNAPILLPMQHSLWEHPFSIYPSLDLPFFFACNIVVSKDQQSWCQISNCFMACSRGIIHQLSWHTARITFYSSKEVLIQHFIQLKQDWNQSNFKGTTNESWGLFGPS